MKATTSTVRRGVYGALVACALGSSAAAAIPSANAVPDGCAASEIAHTISSVSTETGDYLDSHPETNAALTRAAQLPGPQAFAALQSYFAANPAASQDLQEIQQPLSGLSGTCNLPITPPQALQFLQAVTQGGQVLPAAGGLPGGTTAPVGTGPLPGPTPAADAS